MRAKTSIMVGGGDFVCFQSHKSRSARFFLSLLTTPNRSARPFVLEWAKAAKLGSDPEGVINHLVKCVTVSVVA
jgi:hypothetical protein